MLSVTFFLLFFLSIFITCFFFHFFLLLLSRPPPSNAHLRAATSVPQALGWVRVRAGREDCQAFAVRQVRADKFMVCFLNVATFVTAKGDVAPHPEGYPDKIVFETAPQTCVWTPEAVIAFSENRMERRSIATGKITHQMKDKGEKFRVVSSGREGNIIIETRGEGEKTSHLYLLVRKVGAGK